MTQIKNCKDKAASFLGVSVIKKKKKNIKQTKTSAAAKNMTRNEC